VLAAVVVGAAAIGTGSDGGLRDHPGALIAIGVAIGVVFGPLLRAARWIAQRVAYGRRATPYEVLSTFSRRIGETYAADDVLPRVAEVVGTATGAESCTVWLALGHQLVPEASWPERNHHRELPLMPGTITVEGEDVFEVTERDELLGVLSVRMSPSEPMDHRKEALIRDVAAQAALVLRNVRLVEDVRASRRRIVAAQDERAKKLERDIHDGAQQQLVALSVKQRLAAGLVGKDDERLRHLLTELAGETQGALEDLRDLARGIYPPLLADKGLGAALEAQARKAVVPTTVEAAGVGRFPADVESAVYFSCLEALQNVAKYAEATSARIELSDGAGGLRFTVTDDGRGFDASATSYGTGLQGIADRLAAVGGTLVVTSQPGSGTTITGTVPVMPA
jgi:signal transduction histidine kinase